MKATGVVRRIDDLGRIVIPKEIRRNLRIREGDSLEIYTDSNDAIILKKYSHIENVNNCITQYLDAVYSINKKDVIVTDNERIIAVAGSFRKDIVGKRIDMRLDDKIQRRNLQVFERGDSLDITENLVLNSPAVLKPVTVQGDLIGSVVIINDSGITELEITIVEMISLFISNFLES